MTTSAQEETGMTQQAVAEQTLEDVQEQALLERIHAGELIEDMEELISSSMSSINSPA